jgi:hypothetical protein
LEFLIGIAVFFGIFAVIMFVVAGPVIFPKKRKMTPEEEKRMAEIQEQKRKELEEKRRIMKEGSWEFPAAKFY